jgi:fatty-acid desaturase
LNYLGQQVDPQTISIQTFLTIWWLKYLSRITSVIIMGVELIFLIVFIAITAGIHTAPGKKYYSAPSPVSYFMSIWLFVGKTYMCDSTGAG